MVELEVAVTPVLGIEEPLPVVRTRVIKHMLLFIAPIITSECFRRHIINIMVLKSYGRKQND